LQPVPVPVPVHCTTQVIYMRMYCVNNCVSAGKFWHGVLYLLWVLLKTFPWSCICDTP